MYDELVNVLRNNADHYGYEAEDGLVHLLTNAADAIETMCEMVATAHGELANVIQSYEESKPSWIPAAERLPEDGEWVLVWGSGQKIPTMMFRVSGAWIDDQYEFHTTVTHWMPLPTPPKEK